MKNFYIRTFGCTANKSDSEIMVALLREHGYQLSSLNEADYVIVNTCGVKKPSEEKIMNLLKRLSKLDKKLIIAGCLPKINFPRIEREIPRFSAILDPQSIDRIAEILRKLEDGYENLMVFSDEPPLKPSLPKSLFNPVIGIVQISEGCNLACSYCCTRFARGKLKCFPPKEIVESVKRLTKIGCKEIHLTSQDNASYNFNGVRLPELIQNICKIEGKFFVRVGMMNPTYVKSFLDELVSCYKDEKIFKFLHLPIQSLNPRVLSLMRRGYTPRDITRILKKFFEEIQNLTFATDVIVGFPSESEEEFEETIKFVERFKPDIVNLSKFGARPRTEASKLKPLPQEIVKKRSKRLFELCREISLQKNEKWLGWEGECLIDEKGLKKSTWIGRNFAYKPIVINFKKNLLGKFVEVEVIAAKSTYLVGKLI